MVIYDDLDTPTASVRLRAKGGHGGHNGMRSIIQHLSSNEFPRIKVGIGRPSEGVPVVNYVLQDFSKGEREKIDGALGDVVQVVRAALALGMERAVSGVRVDADGNAVTPKGSHQNGKGVKEKQKKTRLGSDAEPAAGTEEESGARPQPSKDVVQGVASPATAGAP